MEKDIKSLIEIKAKLLCQGIRETEAAFDLFRLQNPSGIGKSGMVGLHFLLADTLPVLASTTYKFDTCSDFEITKDQKGRFILKGEGSQTPLTPIPTPNWYGDKTASGKPMASIFAHEGVNYLHQQYTGCAYQSAGLGCKFCGAGSFWLPLSPEEVAETVLKASSQDSNYQVCLGGGARSSSMKDTEFFSRCVQQIRAHNPKIPIWIEMVPPETNTQLQQLIEAGVTAFGFNLEIWSDQIRRELCPGKSKISKTRYFEAWHYIQERLGPNRVNTALIAGLEPEGSALEGVREISQSGVQITLLPFKPWDNSALASREPAEPAMLLRLAHELAAEMRKNNIKPEQNFGCANCSSCTLEGDILRFQV